LFLYFKTSSRFDAAFFFAVFGLDRLESDPNLEHWYTDVWFSVAGNGVFEMVLCMKFDESKIGAVIVDVVIDSFAT
jgi:hypothetical protein